jgi:hypothetical protein
MLLLSLKALPRSDTPPQIAGRTETPVVRRQRILCTGFERTRRGTSGTETVQAATTTSKVLFLCTAGGLQSSEHLHFRSAIQHHSSGTLLPLSSSASPHLIWVLKGILPLVFSGRFSNRPWRCQCHGQSLHFAPNGERPENWHNCPIPECTPVKKLS